MTLKLEPSNIVLHECSLHARDGRRWIGLPSKPQLDSESRHRKEANGKGLWAPIVEIPEKASRERFQQSALAAVDRLLGKGDAP